MSIVRTLGLTAAAAATLALAAAALAQTAGPSPIQVASEQERQRELGDLGLKDTRPGANNRDPASPLYPNYDEAKANPAAMPTS